MSEIKETFEKVADTATGVAVEAAEAITEPGETIREVSEQTRELERRGHPANVRLSRQATGFAEETAKRAREVLNGTIPERVASRGLRLVKARARRHDMVGDATYRMLEFVHDGLGSAVNTLSRLETAVEPPTRPGGRRVHVEPKAEKAGAKPAVKPAAKPAPKAKPVARLR